MTIRLYYVGKTRDSRIAAAARDYLERASRWIPCEMRQIDPRRADLWRRHAQASKVFLDAAGKAMDSAQFAELLRQARLLGRDLVFVVGGAEGLPAGWAQRADLLLSLSPMTLAHELARLVLAEQIYRALAALHGHPYPK